jgi:diguanylate cyclase (GGDEF)-like protein
MRALSTVADVLEPAFAVLSIVAGIAVIFAALRLITKLILLSHRLISLSFLTAAIAIVASEVIEVFASISRPSTVADTAEEFTVLIAICSVGVALHLIGRAEREEVSPLMRWANFDELTGLASRSFFRRAASRRIDLSENHGAPLSCVVLDVDDFKPYNDRYGHEAGDRVLQGVASVLSEEARATDLVARYGGEEFVVLANAEVEGTVDFAERVRGRVERECMPERESFLARRITVSLGIASFSERTRTLDELVRAADAAMYRAKRMGKNRVSIIE